MFKEELEKLEDLLFNSKNGFLIKLRLNSKLDLDMNHVENIKSVIKQLSEKWKNCDYIPKKACDIFVDFILLWKVWHRDMKRKTLI